MQAFTLDVVRRRACPTSCIATARTCVHHLPGNLLAAIQRMLSFVMERRSTPFAPNQCHNFSSTFTRGNLRQHYFQRLQRRRRRVQLWSSVCLTFLRDPPRAHIGLAWLSLVSLRPSCLDGCFYILWRRMYSTSSRLALAQSSGSSHPPLVSFQGHPCHKLSNACSSWCMSFCKLSCTWFVPFFLSISRTILLASSLHLLLYKLLLVLSQLFLNCLGDLMYPCS